MKLKSLLAPLALLVLSASSANAQQLPGLYSLGAIPDGYWDQLIDGRRVRLYWNGFLPASPAFFSTAALISNPTVGAVPSCNYSSSNRTFVNANGRLSHEFYRGSSVLWRSCTTSTLLWPPTGQELLFASYPGSFRPSGWTNFEGTVILPRARMDGSQIYPRPIASEWTVW